MLSRHFFDRAYRVTSVFGAREPFRNGPHRGVDYATPEGTPVYAPEDGRIHKAVSVDKSSNGLHVVLQTNGKGQGWFIHLSKVLVRQGDEVKAGDVIGLTGNTGSSSGPHLHVGWWKAGSPVDVETILPPPAPPAGGGLGPLALALLFL